MESVRGDDVLAIAAALTFRATPAGSFEARRTEWRRAIELGPPEMAILLKFAQPAAVDSVFDPLAAEFELERELFDELVASWLRRGVLVRADGSDSPVRLESFRAAVDRYFAEGGKSPFALRSPFELQQPDFYYPGLNTLQIHPKGGFPWVPRLEAAAAKIRSELEAMIAARSGFSKVYSDNTSNGAWAGAYFWIFGGKVEANCERCPETAALLESIPGVTTFSTALFSALAPGTNLFPHYGLTNAKLRCQLPLVLPPRCGLRVGDREVPLREGECALFDDSFLHTAWNASDRPRFVLLFDFFHPDLSRDEIDFLVETVDRGATRTGYRDQMEGDTTLSWLYESSG